MRPNDFLRYADLGLRLVVTTLVCVGAGLWADKNWGTLPWFTLTGMVLALVAIVKLLLGVGKNKDSNGSQT